jgi:hypothetical protein
MASALCRKLQQSLMSCSIQIGQGLRHFPGKADCRIIDLLDNAKKNGGLISAPTLLGLDIETEVDGERVPSYAAAGCPLIQALDETIHSLRKKVEEKAERLCDSSLLDVKIAYLDNDDPFRLEDDSTTRARLSTKYSWVSAGLLI